MLKSKNVRSFTKHDKIRKTDTKIMQFKGSDPKYIPEQ